MTDEQNKEPTASTPPKHIGRPKGSRDKAPSEARRQAAKQRWQREMSLDTTDSPDKAARNIARMNQLAWECLSLPRINHSDIEAVYERTRWYLNACTKYEIRPGFAGLASALGITRRRLFYWGTPNHYDDDAHREYMARMRSVMEQFWEMYMQQGSINPVAGIFLGKNNYGYRDQQEMVVTPNNPLGDRTDVRALEAKYAEAVVVDPDDDDA